MVPQPCSVLEPTSRVEVECLESSVLMVKLVVGVGVVWPVSQTTSRVEVECLESSALMVTLVAGVGVVWPVSQT